MTNPLIQKLERRDTLSEAERQALSSVILRTRTVRFGEIIVHEDQHYDESTLLLEGFAARTKMLRSGKRQITAVQVTGDFVDLHSFLLKRIDHNIEALTPCTIANVSHKDLERITEEFPHLTRMLWLGTVLDGAIHRAWIVAMGRLSSLSQIAHFVCEMFLRLEVVGHTKNRSFRLPFTQMEIGDIMGLSSVHVNRVIHELRNRGLLQWQDQIVTILEWDRIRQLAEFDATYLSLQREPR